jgi:hypothetical protein
VVLPQLPKRNLMAERTLREIMRVDQRSQAAYKKGAARIIGLRRAKKFRWRQQADAT